MLGLGSSLHKATVRVLSYIKNNLKIYFDFKSSRAKTLEFVGTGSASFDGTNDYITYNDADTKSALQGIKTLTLMGWCRRLSTGGSFINKGAYYTASTDFGMEFQVHGAGTGASDGRWRFSIDQTFVTWSSPPDDVKTGDGSIYPGPWHHYAVTYNGNASSVSTAANMYIDGELITDTSSGSLATIGTNGDDITIGTNINSGADLNGNTKNVGIWNRVLTQEEIQNVMYKSYADLKGSELTHLQFWADLDSNLNAKNNAGATITGTASNEAAVSTSQYGNNIPRKPRGFDNAPTVQADLIGSGSASFTVGDTDYIDAGTDSNLVLGNNNFSMCGWVKANSLSSHSYMLAVGNNATGKQAGIGFTNANKLFLSTYASPIVYSAASSTLITTNKWIHLAASYDGSTDYVWFYLDGVLYEKISITTDVEVGKIVIGAHTGTDGGHWDGNIAQLGIWDRTLSQEEIQSIKEKTYSELTTSEKANLVSWWGLDADISGAVEDLDGTESLGSELVDNVKAYKVYRSDHQGIDLDDNSGGWLAGTQGNFTTNTVTVTSSSVTITYGNNAIGASIYLGNWTTSDIGHLLSSNIVIGSLYKFSCTVSNLTGSDLKFDLTGGSSSDAQSNIITEGTNVFYMRATDVKATAIRVINMSSGEELTLSNISFKLVTGANHGSFV